LFGEFLYSQRFSSIVDDCVKGFIDNCKNKTEL
jgi:hypothetical protein